MGEKETLNENVELTNKDILLLIYREALAKGLQVYIFTRAEALEYVGLNDTLKPEDRLVFLAKNKENAIYNLQNNRKIYLLKNYNESDKIEVEKIIAEFLTELNTYVNERSID